MTRDEILKKEPGPEMDMLVVVKVLGVNPGIFKNHPPARYSKDMGAAWTVLEKIKEITPGAAWADEEGPWFLFCKSIKEMHGWSVEGFMEIFTDVDALTICRAALLTTLEKGQS